MFGFKEKEHKLIVGALKKFPEIESAKIFGSRALGNYKPSSDVDVAIYGRAVTRGTIVRLKNLLEEELPLPYFFDIIDYNSLSNGKLIGHIDNNGLVLFQQDV